MKYQRQPRPSSTLFERFRSQRQNAAPKSVEYHLRSVTSSKTWATKITSAMTSSADLIVSPNDDDFRLPTNMPRAQMRHFLTEEAAEADGLDVSWDERGVENQSSVEKTDYIDRLSMATDIASDDQKLQSSGHLTTVPAINCDVQPCSQRVSSSCCCFVDIASGSDLEPKPVSDAAEDDCLKSIDGAESNNDTKMSEWTSRCSKVASVSVEEHRNTWKPRKTFGELVKEIKERIIDCFQASDNRLAMKLFGNQNALMRERRRQRSTNFCVIHPCSDFR